MAQGKWISGLSAEMPVDEAARRVLQVRLRVVASYIKRVQEAPESEAAAENVHQLRVSTRRSDAALRIFARCLPRRVRRATRRSLRRLRGAAGSVRDADVFLIDLLQRRRQRPAEEHPALDLLVGHALSQRRAAQPSLVKACRKVMPFEQVVQLTLEAIRPPRKRKEAHTLGALAQSLLTELQADLEETARGDLEDHDRLHQVRIAGKRLRYAMEIFSDCFPTHFREVLYAQVEQMQEVLGRANDSQVAGQRLGALREHLQQAYAEDWSPYAPGLEELLRFHEQRIEEERRNFLAWWEKWQSTGAAQLRAEARD